MSTRRQRKQRRVVKRTCISCGGEGPHFVPPSLGDEGFFYCTQVLLDGKAINKETAQ